MARRILFLVVLVALADSALAAWGDGPLFDKLVHDFGPIPRGPTQTTSFRLTNNTGKPLHFGSLRIPCSCVSASIGKDLAAGETTTVDVQLDTRRVSGPLTKPIFVQFDRPYRRKSGSA